MPPGTRRIHDWRRQETAIRAEIRGSDEQLRARLWEERKKHDSNGSWCAVMANSTKIFLVVAESGAD